MPAGAAIRNSQAGWFAPAVLILLSAELYLQYMFLDWRVGNWQGPEADGASKAAGLVMALALSLQPFCAWFLICARLRRPAFIAALSKTDRPLPWRFTLALTATVCITFACALALYFATGIPPVGAMQNELATGLERLCR
jgi:hypothetical protein